MKPETEMSGPVEVFYETYEYEENREVERVRVSIRYRNKATMPGSLYGSANTADHLRALTHALTNLRRTYKDQLKMEQKAHEQSSKN